MDHEIASFYEICFYLTLADMIDPKFVCDLLHVLVLNLSSACARRLKKRLLPNMICLNIYSPQSNMH